MTNAPPARQIRGKVLNLRLAEDEHAFVKAIAQSLNIIMADVVRDAASLSICGSDDPTWTARENHAQQAAVVDKWRLRDSKGIAPAPKLPVSPITLVRADPGPKQ